MDLQKTDRAEAEDEGKDSGFRADRGEEILRVYPDEIITLDELKKICLILKHSDEEGNIDEILEKLGIKDRSAAVLGRKIDLLQAMLEGEVPEGLN
ncbi:MAG TPA: hypothetical protein ENG47_00060 [Candidatus Aerophobetes bacterium]|uniref:Uncharacterized protein n=1 Tax=Aerophobetes bacterium TaxID=2030807 RepID=A0A7V0MZ00_UNCAE|nr:hypothetical protein [Candidatus Aerophobetes bacterium]